MKKRLGAIGLAAMLVLGLAACGGGSDSEPSSSADSASSTREASSESASTSEGSGSADGGYVIGYSNMNRVNAHCIKIADSIKETVEGAGYEYIETDAGDDAATQLSDIDDLISYGCDAIIIDPVDSNGISFSVQACADAGIAVFIVDVECADTTNIVSTVATNNYLAGQQLAEYLIELAAGEPITMAVIDYSISETVNDRTAGFFDTLDESGVEYEVVSRQDATATTVDAGLELAENFLQAYGDELTDIFAFNDLTAQGSINACIAAGLEDIRVFGIDGHDDSIDLVASGEQTATAMQLPVEEGATVAQTAIDYLSGKDVEELIYIDPILVTQENAAEYQN